ncbi:MAG TPA: hypothetical protein VF796_08980, partial [Humisphaera sp.]
TVRFLRNLRRRRPQDRGAIGVVLGFLFFPLMALSIIWPITLPVIAVVLWKERNSRSRRASLGAGHGDTRHAGV